MLHTLSFHFSASPCLQLLNSSIQQQNVQPARGMANLKAIAIRLKSVKNIQKITQSMKMVSAAKYARAERDLKVSNISNIQYILLYYKYSPLTKIQQLNSIITTILGS